MTPRIFYKKVIDFYRKNGRTFPWRPPTLKLRRGKADPYRILVSEMMLQQTQTHRVVPKYKAFIRRWPTVQALARAQRADVLKEWQGLGYNRRAKFLHEAAQRVAAGTGSAAKGVFPQTMQELQQLPGIGPYTAGAVMVFAYNQPVRDSQGRPVVIIETNIRAALIHEFFSSPRRSPSEGGPTMSKIPDNQLLPILKKVVALAPDNSRELYSALMDYGAFIKQRYPNPSRRSAHYTRQSPFAGSSRQIRGQILRLLATQAGGIAEKNLLRMLPVPEAQGRVIVGKLLQEGMIARQRGRYVLP